MAATETFRRSAKVARDWILGGRRVVGAVLAAVEGSAPLTVGATMLISDHGEVEGSITGGCVEAAVVAEARAVLADGGTRMVRYGFSDAMAGEVGLSCGGTVHVFIYELAGETLTVERECLGAIADGVPVAVATLIDGERAGAELAVVGTEALGSVGPPALLDENVARDAAGMLGQGRSAVRHYGRDGVAQSAEVSVLIRSYGAPPAVLLFGAVDFSAALGRLAGQAGYAVTIFDPRTPFLRSPRFEEAGERLALWPDDAFSDRRLGPRDAVVVMTHDPKFDEPALLGALSTDAGYIGALGSRGTTADRIRRLRAAGVDEAAIERIHAPCGLDIGGSTPEEVAVSILAEMIAERSGQLGGRLRDGTASIHAARPAAMPDRSR